MTLLDSTAMEGHVELTGPVELTIAYYFLRDINTTSKIKTIIETTHD